jgi:hypothetical protein
MMNEKRAKRITRAVVAVWLAIGLGSMVVGCANPPSENDGLTLRDAPPDKTYTFEQEVEPGRFVTCVFAENDGITNTATGGLSCDWVGYHQGDTP